MKPSFMNLTYVLAAAMLVSCSIKEDRSGCPCCLVLDVDAFVDGGFCNGGAVAVRSRGLDFSGEVELPSLYGSGYVKEVPRTMVSAACAAGIRSCSLDGSIVRVPLGKRADSLMAFACTVIPDGDELVVVTVPHKQYCLVHMIAGPPEEYAGYDVMITGGCSGLDLLSLKPERGEMRTFASHKEDGTFEAVLLRQDERASLVLDMLDGAGGSLYTIDLSAALEEASYDWNKTDLDDVTLRVDYARAEVFIEISEWDSDENYRNVEI